MRLAVLATLCFAVPAWAQAPARLSYQGRLLKADGTAEQGAVQITFSLFANAAGGSALWTEQQQLVLTNGFYATHLPSTLGGAPAFPANLFDGTERYLELSVAGNALLPRHRVASVPYALRAGYDSAVVQSRVSSTCSGGQAIAQINADGTVVCSTASAGGVSAVTASAPLTSSGGASPNLAMPAASGSVSGYLASSDWLTFSSKVSGVGAGTATTIGGTTTNPTVSVAFGATSTTAVVGNDARLSDARAPTAGSSAYLQNQSAANQAASFSISGSGNIGGNLSTSGTVKLGSGGVTFGAIKSVNVSWDPPSTSANGSNYFNYTLPETGAVLGVVLPSTGLSCAGPWGCTYSVDPVYRFNSDATSKVTLVFNNGDGVSRDPPSATWTIYYVNP